MLADCIIDPDNIQIHKVSIEDQLNAQFYPDMIVDHHPVVQMANDQGYFMLVSILAILLVEFAVFRRVDQGKMTSFRLVVFTSLANIVSWLPGAVISAVKPKLFDLIGWKFLSQLRALRHGVDGEVAMNLVIACLLSFLLEFGFLGMFRKQFPLRKLCMSVGAANICSYVVLGLLLLYWPLA